jgi:hypothetical protein
VIERLFETYERGFEGSLFSFEDLGRSCGNEVCKSLS